MGKSSTPLQISSTSTSSCPSYFELETPFQLYKSQRTLNYWTCIQLFKILYGFEIITVLVSRIFSLSSDFIIVVYCVTTSTAASQSGELDFDPTSFTSHRQYMHRNVGNRIGFQLIWSYFRCKNYSFQFRSPRTTSTPATAP